MPDEPYAQVLGIAQDGGHPQPGCRRPCCVRPGVTPHLTTCVAVIDGGVAWLLDAGPDLPRHLDRLHEREVSLGGILLTHAHMGHYTGLMFLGREAMDTSNLPVWAAPRMVSFLESNGPWDQLVTAGNIDLRVLQGPLRLSPRIRVDSFPVPHRGEYSETLGFRVTGPRASLLYVPDTDGWAGWEMPVEGHLESVDIAFLDATFFTREELPGRDMAMIAHPPVIDSLRRFAELGDGERKKIHFTHLNHTNPLLRSGSDEYTRVLRAGMMVATERQLIDL